MAQEKGHEMAKMPPSRTGSIFETHPQVLLNTALRTNDKDKFRKLLDHPALDLEYVYGPPDNKTILELAISDPNKHEYVDMLLKRGVQVNKINEVHKAAPIHFAVDSRNINALKSLLNDPNIDVNVRKKGNNTALLWAIKSIEIENDNEDDEDEKNTDEDRISVYEDMIELLLKAGCNPNAPDIKGITPIYSAAKQGLIQIIQFIKDYANINNVTIDLDTFKDIKGKNARFYLKKAFPHLEAQFGPPVENNEAIDADIDKLLWYISKHDEENFIRDFSRLVNQDKHRSVLSSSGTYTLMQYATEKGLENVVEKLLLNGVDPNEISSGDTRRPIAIACLNGFSKILKMFIDKDTSLAPVNGESLLQITIKGRSTYLKNPKADFDGCIRLLLDPKNLDNVNHSDLKGNTALHYAVRNGDNETVLELLRNGACVGLRNKFYEPPLADINSKTLKTYLDECVTTNGSRPNDDDYEIHMKYRFLVYPNNSQETEESKPLVNNNVHNEKEYDSILTPETDALLYMTTHEDLKPLLKHPVITSFLYLKWQRISCLFYTNITFYTLFSLSLILYIILGYCVEEKQSDSIETLNVINHFVAIIGLILLIIRELFQLLVSPTRYLQSIENWMEVSLIIVTAWILCYSSAPESTKQQLSAIAILLSSAELVLLIGQIPCLSTNIVMLKTVSWNFFKFLLWYCILILAFALSFYTLFKKNIEEDQKAPNPNKTGNEEEEEDFFEDPGRSIFKTIVMLTGEFDASSIKFSTFPVTSHIIFMVFVFMIPIVLFNLLNGLAVGDTQEIRANAELVGHISMIKLISYFEGVFIGNIQSYSKPSLCCAWVPKYLPHLYLIKPKALAIFGRRIKLFPIFLPKYMIIVKPNQDYKIDIPRAEHTKIGDDDDIENGGCFLQECKSYRLDSRIVKNAKLIISEKTQVSEYDDLKKELSEIKKLLQRIQTN